MRPARTRLQVIEAALVLSLFVLSVGCNGFFVDPTLTTITVTPVTPSVAEKGTQQMTATGTYDDGSVKNITGSVSWSLEPAGIATITNGGLLTGVAQGTTTLNAASANITGSTQVTVLLANVISIQVAPSNTSIASGATVPYTATATLADGTKQDISSTATWTVVQQGTTTQPTCISIAAGQPFNVTDNGGCTLPLTLNIQATYGNSNSGTSISSNIAVLVVTS
jgi:Bacterial Ig-like domain (group 2)